MDMPGDSGSMLVVYEPDNAIRKGYRVLFKEIATELCRNRWLIRQLFKRDCFALYKQSFIGVFWAFLVPVISVGTFAVLSHSGVFSIGAIDVPYPVFAISGLAFWQLFSAGLIANSNSLVKAGSMIAKINFSKKSLVIASTGTSIISFLVQLVLLFGLFACYGFWPGWRVLSFPLFAAPIILFTLGIGFILALLNGVMRDIGNALSIVITFLMFLTPVLYARPETGIVATVTKYNPMYFLASVPRQFILGSGVCEWRGYVISCAGAVVSFFVCLLVFHLTETRVAERI